MQTRGRVDAITTLCLVLIALGWFGLDTLVFSLGHIRQSTRFYELLSILRQPSMLVTGVGSGHGWTLVGFAIVCAALLVASLVPWVSRERTAWLPGLLPLALMIACAIALYGSNSSLPVDAPVDSLRGLMTRWSNQSLQWASGEVSRHISLGMGGYLALIGSVVLALRSATHYWNARRHLYEAGAGGASFQRR